MHWSLDDSDGLGPGVTLELAGCSLLALQRHVLLARPVLLHAFQHQAALAGIRFGIFYRGFKIDENLPFEPYNIWLPGWVGHGWSAWEPRNAPPAMINGTAVMGWIDSDGGQQVSPDHELPAHWMAGTSM